MKTTVVKYDKMKPVWFSVVPCDKTGESVKGAFPVKCATLFGVRNELRKVNSPYGYVSPVQRIDNEWITVTGRNLISGLVFNDDYGEMK